MSKCVLLSVVVGMMVSHDTMAMRSRTCSTTSLNTAVYLTDKDLPCAKIQEIWGGDEFKKMIENLKKTGNYDIVNKSGGGVCCCCRGSVGDYMAVQIKKSKEPSESLTDFYTLVREAYTYCPQTNIVDVSKRDKHSVYKDDIFNDFINKHALPKNFFGAPITKLSIV